MKKLFLMIAMVFPIVVFSGCSDDDEESIPVTKENIIGNWKITRLNSVGTSISGFISVNKEKASIILYYDGENKSPGIDIYDYNIDGNKLNLMSEGKTAMIVDVKSLTESGFNADIDNIDVPMGSGNMTCSRIKTTSTDITKNEILGIWTIDDKIEGISNVEMAFLSNDKFNLSADGYDNGIGYYTVCSSTIHLTGDVYKMIVKSKGDKTMNLEIYIEDLGKFEVTAKKR